MAPEKRKAETALEEQGLTAEELQAEEAQELPDREEMSIFTMNLGGPQYMPPIEPPTDSTVGS
jgi:hypothetical protein